MRNFITIEEKGSVREFIINDLSNVGLRIDTTKHRNVTVGQTSPHIASNPKHQHGARVFNVPLHQMDTISVRIDDFDLTVPIFLRWCFDCIRRSIKHEGLFRKSGGSQRVKELMSRIEDGSLTPTLSSSNTVFDVCSLFKEFLRRLTYPLITYPLQDLLLDCFSMRSLSSEKKIDIYLNILLLLPDEHLHTLIYILRFLHEITLHERDNKMNAKNLAICVGPGIMRTSSDGKANIMTEQCATSVSDIVETLILNATKLGYVTDSVYDRSQMLLEMRQKEAAQNGDDSFAIENGIKHGIGGGKMIDPANTKKRRSGSVKEFLVHMTNRLRRRSGSNNDSRDQTNAFLDQSGKLSSSHTREHRHHYQHYQQHSIQGHCLSSSSTSSTTSKRKSSDDPNGGNSKRGKTKTSSQEKTPLPNTNRFTSPITAFRRKKKTSSHTNDPGFPFKIEHSHLPQLLHFTDEVPVRFMNTIVNPASSASASSSSSLPTAATSGSMAVLTTSMISTGSTIHDSLQPLSVIPNEAPPPLLSSFAPLSSNNKSLDTKKLNLLDSWKWPKSSRKAERKPLIAIHAPMLATSAMNPSFNELSPSPIKAIDDPSQTIGGTSLLMHSSFGAPRRHSDDVTSASFTTTTFRPRRSISSSAGQQQTRHVVCMLNNYSHSLPSTNQQTTSNDDDDQAKDPSPDITQEQGDDSFSDADEEIADELNLAVVVGNEDVQSLKGFTTEQTNNENGALDVAFIDETDLCSNKNEQGTSQVNVVDTPTSNSDNETQPQKMIIEENSTEIKHPVITESNVPILIEKTLNKEEDLDEILRRNENRGVRLTDSDDEDHENFNVKIVPLEDNIVSTTPKMPIRLSSSISNLISSSSLTAFSSSISNSKERCLSCSLSQPSNDLFHPSTTKWTSLNLEENDENISLLNRERDSILDLKNALLGRVQKQVRAFEQQTNENVQNRSIQGNSQQKPIFHLTTTNTQEQRTIEEALTRGNKILLSTNGSGEIGRSRKRLRNTPLRRWKEQAKDFERHHQLTSPRRLLHKKKK